MNDNGILGATLGQLGQTVKKAGQQIVKMPEEMAKDVGGQVGGAPLRPASPGFEGQAKPGEKPAENKPQQQWQSDEERVKFLRDLYGSAQPSPEATAGKANSNPPAGGKPTEFEEQIEDKSPEEQKKLMELRGQLHQQNYYDPTFNRPQKQEERPAEKVENEKKQEMMELQKKEENKPPPLAVQKAAQRVENLPGAG